MVDLEQFEYIEEDGTKRMYYNTPFGVASEVYSPITVEEAASVFEALDVKVFQNVTDSEIYITLVDDERVVRPRECIAIPNNLAFVAKKISELVEIPLIEIANAVVNKNNNVLTAINDYNDELERQKEIRREARFLIAEQTNKLFYKLKQIERECLLDE